MALEMPLATANGIFVFRVTSSDLAKLVRKAVTKSLGPA